MRPLLLTVTLPTAAGTAEGERGLVRREREGERERERVSQEGKREREREG